MDKDNLGYIVFYDGVCNICNRFVQMVNKNDSKRRFRFFSFQSKEKNFYLPYYPNVNSKGESVVLIAGSRAYDKSDAVLKIITTLNGFWKISYVFYLAPRPIRDALYIWLARNRYWIFRMGNNCILEPKKLK